MRLQVNWHRVLWIAVFWTIITNSGACKLLFESKQHCNPLILVTCEPE